MRIVFFLLITLNLSYAKKGDVIICTGPTAYAYHSSTTCSGLNRCSGEIKTIDKDQAIRLHRKPCHRCFIDKSYHTKKKQ